MGKEKTKLPNGVVGNGNGGEKVVRVGGSKKKDDGLMGFKGKGEGGQSLALPRGVVEEGVRITRECLELVCEVPE